MKLNAYGDVYEVGSEESLVELINELNNKKINYNLVGWGANQVFRSMPKKTLIKLKLDFDPKYLLHARDIYDLPASIGLVTLQSHARKFNLSGWEYFTGIPGSLGGAIAMNAGTALGEIGSLVTQVEVLRKNLLKETIIICKDSFSYRGNNFLNDGDVILSAKLKHFGIDPSVGQRIVDYLDYRKASQPLKSYNCGCVFKNSDKAKAGQTIDDAGLKGFNYKGLYVSEIHANFIENRDLVATGDDLLVFIEKINERTQNQSGFKFELEVKIV